MTATIATTDDWFMREPGRGRGKPPFSIVPEPAVYGLAFVGAALAVVIWKRIRNN